MEDRSSRESHFCLLQGMCSCGTASPRRRPTFRLPSWATSCVQRLQPPRPPRCWRQAQRRRPLAGQRAAAAAGARGLPPTGECGHTAAAGGASSPLAAKMLPLVLVVCAVLSYIVRTLRDAVASLAIKQVQNVQVDRMLPLTQGGWHRAPGGWRFRPAGGGDCRRPGGGSGRSGGRR